MKHGVLCIKHTLTPLNILVVVVFTGLHSTPGLFRTAAKRATYVYLGTQVAFSLPLASAKPTLCRDLRFIQIDILNSNYSTTRFAFTYAWWSAYGFSRHVKNNAAEAAEMELIDQEKVRYTGWCRQLCSA